MFGYTSFIACVALSPAGAPVEQRTFSSIALCIVLMVLALYAEVDQVWRGKMRPEDTDISILLQVPGTVTEAQWLAVARCLGRWFGAGTIRLTFAGLAFLHYKTEIPALLSFVVVMLLVANTLQQVHTIGKQPKVTKA